MYGQGILLISRCCCYGDTNSPSQA